MWNPKSPIMPEGPDIIRSWPEVSREPVAPPEILISCMDGLGSSIDFGYATASSDITLVSHLPDSSGLAV
jgi:hypothetical protein